MSASEEHIGAANVTAKLSPKNVLTMLLDWAGDQDNWVQNIVNIVVRERRGLSDEQVSETSEIFLQEKALSEGTPPDIELTSSSRAAQTATSEMRLVSLRHMANVNALDPEQGMEFNSRLTVCFGENGSGKTGYMRILKAVAGARTAQTVLPDITGMKGDLTPHARIVVNDNGMERVVEWRGENRIEPFDRLNVFDTGEATVHVSEELSYTYTPAELSLFPLVTDGIERVQKTVETAKDARKTSEKPWDDPMLQQGNLSEQVRRLLESRDIGAIESLAQVSPEEEASLQGLRQQVASLGSGSVELRMSILRQRTDTLSRAVSIGETVVGFDRESYLKAVEELRTARDQHESATKEAFSGAGIPGVLGDSWRAFVEAAEEHIRNTNLDPYPSADAHCIYCQQPLTNAAVVLIQKYRDYNNADFRLRVDRAAADLQGLIQVINNLQIEETGNELSRLIESSSGDNGPPPELVSAAELLKQSGLICKSIIAEEESLPSAEDAERALTAVKKLGVSVESELGLLDSQGEERKRGIETLQVRIDELVAKLKLRDLMPTTRNYLLAEDWIDTCSKHLGVLPRVKRGLTQTAKNASTELLNNRFQELFENERSALRAPPVKLEFPGREGQAQRRKALADKHTLDEVLSEGEQKAIALADFLA